MGLLEKLHQQIVQSDWTKKFEEEGKMNKEKLMQFLSEAIDNGADIRVHMGQFNKSKNFAPVTRKEAFKLATVVQEAIGGEVAESTNEGVCETFDIESETIKVWLSHSPHRYMKEDVDLSGSAGIA